MVFFSNIISKKFLWWAKKYHLILNLEAEVHKKYECHRCLSKILKKAGQYLQWTKLVHSHPIGSNNNLKTKDHRWCWQRRWLGSLWNDWSHRYHLRAVSNLRCFEDFLDFEKEPFLEKIKAPRESFNLSMLGFELKSFLLLVWTNWRLS